MGKSANKEEPMSETRAKRTAYGSGLSTSECEEFRPYIPQPKRGGRPAEYDRLEILNAIRYLLRTGCAWRLLSHDFPPWGTVTITSPNGAVMEHGSRYMAPYGKDCEKRKHVKRNRAPPSLIASL